MFTLLAFICALLSACHSFMSAGSSRPATDETTHAATSTASAPSRCVTPPPSAAAHSSAFRLHGSPGRPEYKTPPRGGTALGRGASECKDEALTLPSALAAPLTLARTPSYVAVRELKPPFSGHDLPHHIPDVDDDKEVCDALVASYGAPPVTPSAGDSEKPMLRESTFDAAITETPTDSAAFFERLRSPVAGRSTPRTPTFAGRRSESRLALAARGTSGGAAVTTPSPDSPESFSAETFSSTDIVHWFIHHVLEYAERSSSTGAAARAVESKHDLYDSSLDRFIPFCKILFLADPRTEELRLRIDQTALIQALEIIRTIEWPTFVALCQNPRATWRSHASVRAVSEDIQAIIAALANLICTDVRNVKHITIVYAIILHAVSLIPDATISLEPISTDDLKSAFLTVFMPLYQTDGIDKESFDTYVTAAIKAFGKIIALTPRVIPGDGSKKTLSVLMNHYYAKAHLRSNIALCKRILATTDDSLDRKVLDSCLRKIDLMIQETALYRAAGKVYHAMLTQELISLAQAIDPSYASENTHIFVNHLHILFPTAEITKGSAETSPAAKVGGGHIMTDELTVVCASDKKYAYVFDNDTNETPVGMGSTMISPKILTTCRITDTFEIEYTGRAFDLFAPAEYRRDNRDELSRDSKRTALLFGRTLNGEQLFQFIDILINETLSIDEYTRRHSTAASAAASSVASSGTRTTSRSPAATGGSGTRSPRTRDFVDIEPCLIAREVTRRTGCDFVRVAADIIHKPATITSELQMASRIVIECRVNTVADAVGREISQLIPLRVITLHPLHMIVCTDPKNLCSIFRSRKDALSSVDFTQLAKASTPAKGGGSKSPTKGKRAAPHEDREIEIIEELCYVHPTIRLASLKGIDERSIVQIVDRE